MFRRTKSSSTSSSGSTATDSEGANSAGPGDRKGRPTPTRREAEAAAKARAKPPTDRRSAARQQRAARQANSARIKQGLKAGDEKYLPARDRGPVRRLVRDVVDARLCVAEIAVPLMFVSLLASTLGYQRAGSGILNATLLMVVVDTFLLRFKVRREVRRRFPDEPLKGTTFYAFTRSLQLRFMRMPKPRVRIGQSLPEEY